MKTRHLLTLTLLAALCLPLSADNNRLAGGDISLLPSYEAANTPYYDKSGTSITDLVQYLAGECGWNACRVRLFANPVIINADGTRQGEVQDLEYVTALGKRIKDAGMAFLLDFHYSDTWADPVKQKIPSAWKNFTTEQELADTLYGYTAHCLRTLTEAGAEPDYVQIGNEISYGMLWRSNADKVNAGQTYEQNEAAWKILAKYLKAGAKAVREECPNAKIVIHIERTQYASACVNYFNCLARENVDYDIIGLSFYPFWHGWVTSELRSTLSSLENAFPDKPVQIVETAYYNNYFPVNDSGTKFKTNTVWPGTEAGQDAYLADLISELKDHNNVNGLYYWFPEENGNGGATYNADNIVITSWLNRGLFSPDKHKALKGLYRIKAYLGDNTALEDISAAKADETIWSLTGTPLGNDISRLPEGAYIQHNHIIIK